MPERCPHGDETCPCQDPGDPCHYEGPSQGPRGTVQAMVCPNPTDELTDHTGVLNADNRTMPHCHAEGCGWVLVRLGTGNHRSERPCGLKVLGRHDDPLYAERAAGGLDAIRGTPWWNCGLLRYATP